MSKFGHLKQYDVSKEKTIEFPLYQIQGEPVLILAPATESNRGYYNALLRKSRKNLRAIQSGKIKAAHVKDNRNEDKTLYGEHILVGWKGLKDSEGKEIPFNRTDAIEFLHELPDWIFDEIRAFASDVQNFLEDVIDAQETAKN